MSASVCNFLFSSFLFTCLIMVPVSQISNSFAEKESSFRKKCSNDVFDLNRNVKNNVYRKLFNLEFFQNALFL